MNLREQEPELQVVAFHPIHPVAIDAECQGLNVLVLNVLNDWLYWDKRWISEASVNSDIQSSSGEVIRYTVSVVLQVFYPTVANHIVDGQ